MRNVPLTRIFLAVVLISAGAADWLPAQTISGITRTLETVTYWTGQSVDKVRVRVTGSGAPAAKYIVETSSGGTLWWPVSAAQADAASGGISWENFECPGAARQYRLVVPQPGYDVQPVGRLTQSTPDEFQIVTQAGWTIQINKTFMRILAPGGVSGDNVEFWSSINESLGSKVIKQIFSHRRSYMLEDGTLITASVDLPIAASTQANPMGMVTFISVYDGEESHRIDMQTFTVAWSAARPALGEAEEYDGETARIFFDSAGLRFDNVSDQGDPCSGNSEKIPAIIPLGRRFFNQPSTVNDTFDDPRLGFT